MSVAGVVVTVVMAMVIVVTGGGVSVLRFEESNPPREGHAEQQGCRKFDPVVRVKLDFGEQVGEGDTQEHAGRKAERIPDDDVLALREKVRPQAE